MLKKYGFFFVLAALMAWQPKNVRAADFPSLFDTVAYRSDNPATLSHWRHMLVRFAEEKATLKTCSDAQQPCKTRALLAWQAVIAGQSDRSQLAQLRAINRFVNQWAPKSDNINHQQADFGSTPGTSLQSAGNSETYAIVKYVSLRELGFAAEQLRIVIVQDTLRDLNHVVLAAHVDGKIYIMDNLYQAALPQARVRQYRPHSSVNEQARWSHLPLESVIISSAPRKAIPSTTIASEAS